MPAVSEIAVSIPPSLAILKDQRSHLLMVQSNAKEENISEFLKWYQGPYRDAVLARPDVLKANHYERHEVDITRGRYAPLPFQYLAVYELSIDGAEEAEDAIAEITALHQKSGCAEAPATWLYFPVGEKVGRPTPDAPMLTLAFANGVPGEENEFREWYTTRHIRHALNVPALVSGQCFERTQFQQSGALETGFQIIAIYEQTGSPESILDAFKSIASETFRFPAMDKDRFAESAYRLVQ